MAAAMDHPARARVAEIMVSRNGKENTRGSGYLVLPGWVLTACHVVKDAVSIGVWLGAPRELGPQAGVTVDPGRVLAVPDADLALLPLGKPSDDLLCEPALFGRLDRDPGPAVPAAAVGCPRFKLRPAPNRPGVLLRELEYAIGSIDPLSNTKTDRFAFAVDVAPGPDPEPDKHSPWEGMSGAAVWASGRLIGVVGQHHPPEGLATLTVCPVEQLFSCASESELRSWHVGLSQLPATAGNLWLATPPTVRKIEVERARRAAEDLAPRVLIGRDAELAALSEFASSDLQWRWLQGDAFAGKTALLAWFTLHPPESVDVVACFLRRTTGDNGADYALDVLNRQLALLVRQVSLLPPQSLSERAHDFVDLLNAAAGASHERGNRLLVLIDGLDEYDPTAVSLELAAWLPGVRTLPDQAKLLVASRAGASIDLPQGHPLVGSLQRVTASEAATEIQGAARRELERALKSTGGFASRVICFLAAAGSGLTSSDLRLLLKRRGTDADAYEIEALLGSFLSRSLKRLSGPDESGAPELESAGTQGYAFAHDTLLAEAQALFRDLAIYEDLLDEWADEYARRGWPVETPRYLVRAYTRELARRAHDPGTRDARPRKVMGGALDRLSALARDPQRRDFLLEITGSDYAALTEIGIVQSLLADQGGPDLKAIVELAARRLVILLRNSSTPDDLAIVWARLARFDHAEALARTIADSDDQAEALTQMVAAIAEAGDPNRAEALARTIRDPDRQTAALTYLVTAIAQAGDPNRARRIAADAGTLARTINDPDRQAWAFAELVTAIAETGDLDRAATLARTITDPDCQSWALTKLITAIAETGELEQGEVIARTITRPDGQAEAFTALSAAAAQAGDVDRAYRLSAAAETLAHTIGEPHNQASALSSLAGVVAGAGDLDRARQLAADAEALARMITDQDLRSWTLTRLVTTIAKTGDLEQGEVIARTITRPPDQAKAFAALSAATAQAGDLDRAEALAHSAADPDDRVGALASLVAAVAGAGHLDHAHRLAADAEILARTISNPYVQARSLTSLVTAITKVGDLDHARRLAADAGALARTTTDPMRDAYALTQLAIAVAEAGDLDHAEALARTINEPEDLVKALISLATTATEAGNLDAGRRLAADAETLARRTGPNIFQAEVFTALVTGAAQAGDLDHAEALARTITDHQRPLALISVATTAAETGDSDRARRLAADVFACTPTPSTREAEALASLAITIAKAEAGNLDHAYRVAADVLIRTTSPTPRQAEALASLAVTVAEAGDPDHAYQLADDAETLARTTTDMYYQAMAFATLANAVGKAGDQDRARRLANDAQALVRTITDAYHRGKVLASLAVAAAAAGDPISARRLADDAETLARSSIESDGALAELVMAIVETGDLDRAEALARTITSSSHQARPLAELVTAIVETGDLDRAEALARTITDSYYQASALGRLVTAIIKTGDLDRAESLARTITDLGDQADTLATVATAIARTGHLDRAAHLLATVLVMDMPGTFWVETVSRFFPSAMGDAWDILTGVYAKPT